MSAFTFKWVQNLLPQIWQKAKLVNVGEGIWVLIVLFSFQFYGTFENLQSWGESLQYIMLPKENILKSLREGECIGVFCCLILASVTSFFPC